MADMADEHVDGVSGSIGDRLRAAREAKGLSLDDIATRTRIPIRHLKNIEEENWDALPAVTYSIGFARSYANAVDLDGAEIGRELRDRIGGTRASTAPAEYYEPADPARVPPRWLAISALVLAALLIGAYLLWRSGLDTRETEIAVAEPPAAEGPAAAQPQPEAAQPQPQPQPIAAGQPVAIVATGDVWLQVSDGTGPSLFQGSLSAGERFDVPPTAQDPRLRTGRPQNLRVVVGGRDLGPVDPVERTVSRVSLRAEAFADRAGGAGGGAQPGAAPIIPSPVPTPPQPAR
jgi:cytoskeleton protein RodZ